MSSVSEWGNSTTKLFFELTPDKVLTAVETSGYRCNGRCLALNSYENRVYEVELEESESPPEQKEHPIARRRVVKFYRPGRWTREQILEEHQFLLDLKENEIPVVTPIRFEDGETLHQTTDGELFYALFPKVGGRIPDELTKDQFLWLGRLLARIHNVGTSRKAEHRLELTPETYGLSNLEFLLRENWIPPELKSRYESATRQICAVSKPLFEKISPIRLHGDCHMGNLLWGNDGPFFVDFDDMVRGPEVQDMWLLIPGRDDLAKQDLNSLLEGYDEFRPFDRSQLKLIEVLRALRFVHYTAWLAKRWPDPAFPRAFPQFNTRQYWEEKTNDMEEQLSLIA